MNRLHVFFAGCLLLGSGIGLLSCAKDEVLTDYGISKIYMPQATNQSGGINNNYMIPKGTDSSTYNYAVNTATQKVTVTLGVGLSGISRNGFAVDVKAYPDTVQQLLASKTLDSTTRLMPASMYSLPSRIDVQPGNMAQTFPLTLDINQLRKSDYAGKKLAIAVGISNPSQYVINSAVAKTVVIVDVNELVIGPAVDVTSKYLANAGGPFKAAGALVGNRWGTLTDWLVSSSVLSHQGVGGLASDGDGVTMNMESGWGSPAILNGKIYQTVSLPAGAYAFDPSPWVWQGTKDPAYVVVAPGMSELPDYKAIPSATGIYYSTFDKPRVTFRLTTASKVTLGLVVNYVQDQQGFKTKAVKLYSFPKSL